jgi:hypothetical protein
MRPYTTAALCVKLLPGKVNNSPKSLNASNAGPRGLKTSSPRLRAISRTASELAGIDRGLRAADEGRFATDEQVEAALARLRDA